MNFTFTVNSDETLSHLIGKLRELYKQHRYLRVSMKTGMTRSQLQNQVSHVWYQQLARELREDDALGWKCFAKLNFGVPILRVEDIEFKDFYDLAVKRHLSYEEKLQAMKFMPVTSRMDKDQISRYLEAMQAHFRTKGVLLEFLPEEK